MLKAMSGARKALWIKGPIVLIAAAICLGTFVSAQADSIQRMSILPALYFTAWWIGPLIPYINFCRTIPGSALIGAGFVFGVVASLAAVYGDDHSTAGFGLFTLPVLLYGGMAAALVLETLIVERVGLRS